MKTWLKIVIALVIVLMVIIVVIILLSHCMKGYVYGDPVERTEKIYSMDKEYLYIIIDFVNKFEVTEIYTDKKDEKYYNRIGNGYVDIKGSSDLTSEQEDKISEIVKFMRDNMIDAIHKYQDKNGYEIVSFTVRHGWYSVAVLEYCPHNPDIKERKEANYCNGWYIDDSWIILDYQDEDYSE